MEFRSFSIDYCCTKKRINIHLYRIVHLNTAAQLIAYSESRVKTSARSKLTVQMVCAHDNDIVLRGLKIPIHSTWFFIAIAVVVFVYFCCCCCCLTTIKGFKEINGRINACLCLITYELDKYICLNYNTIYKTI